MKLVMEVPMSAGDAAARLASALAPSSLFDPFARSRGDTQYLGRVRGRRFGYRFAHPLRLSRNLHAVVRGRLEDVPGGGTRVEAWCAPLIPTWLMLSFAGMLSCVFLLLAIRRGAPALWLFVALPWAVAALLSWMNSRVLREEGPPGLAFLRAVLR
ncbi:hypothetical protein HPC49_31095 [Pyxidicoccus fallax]|uniref:Uncharacterized protein n=1 Tax=Pyxidicoccus fallax TaxID=394095 RepID=A0A848L8Y7_9BACT|nr:hypothetical protein [Pyxidicoccus fallax]NMO15017.1 hypothetical protein [Pyxidicoccus fallax]NPC82657.1 hypothetical protein [Pyxidicoccus fallax]